jgi:hypothetical protein
MNRAPEKLETIQKRNNLNEVYRSAAPAAPQRGSRGPRQDLKPVDASRADVFRDEDGDYPGDLYRGGLPRGEFEELADDEDELY